MNISHLSINRKTIFCLFSLVTLFCNYGCKKESFKQSYTKSRSTNVNIVLKVSEPDNPPKKMQFLINEFSIENGSHLLTKPGYTSMKDSVILALKMVSDIFSKKEFKDSLLKYTFDPSKATTCSSYTNPIASKINTSTNTILGLTVYNDLLAQTTAKINISILKRSIGIGSSYSCFDKDVIPTIWTYDGHLISSKKMVFDYAMNIAHEFVHTKGYVHSDSKGLDVPETVASIIKNIKEKSN